ncbi:ADP,ATP carrier protein [Hamiltosporidium magnivora]|uniref:ADP,ATP carrier protein n=1 Tax=Hamiltosporidium magnivora TaxID=148818 RepID=A0A4Q9KV56_9MICR|nr:ADP,ATP carrier protein [Hamiltosporidium magnivora]
METETSPRDRIDPSNSLPTEAQIEAIARSGTGIWSHFKVAPQERPKFWFMCAIFLIIAYIYSVMRDMKDVLVTERLDPASLSYLKMLFVTPISILVVVLLQKPLSRYGVGPVFNAVVIVFGIYNVVYGLVVIPLQNTLEPSPFLFRDSFGDGKMAVRGLEALLGVLLTLNSYTTTIAYVFAELWGNVVLSLLFLNYSNMNCSYSQSMRFTPCLFIFSNVGLFFSGLTMLGICFVHPYLGYISNRWILRSVFIGAGLLCLFIIYLKNRLERTVLSVPICITEGSGVRKQKAHVSLLAGLKELFGSKVLFNTSLIVFLYNLCTNMVEASYKSCMRVCADQKNKAVGIHVMGRQAVMQLVIAMIVIVLLLTPFSTIIQRKGIYSVAVVPPVFALVALVGVFGLAAYNTAASKKSFEWLNTMFAGASAHISAEEFVGLICVSGFKILKYGAFDICKEAISMKISASIRSMFKSVVDGVCGKLGKSGGGLLTTLTNLVLNTNDIRTAAPFSLVLVVLFCFAWIKSVGYLSRKYEESVKGNCDIDLDPFVVKKVKG